MLYRILLFGLLPSRLRRIFTCIFTGIPLARNGLPAYAAQSTASSPIETQSFISLDPRHSRLRSVSPQSPEQGTSRPYDNEKMDRVLRSQCALHIDPVKRPSPGCLLF